MNFVDLRGASGQTYRFRRWPRTGHHAPIAGNYLVLRIRTREVLAIGMLDNLSYATARVAEFPPSAALFTRLNVSRTHREADHADLVAAHPYRFGAAGACHRAHESF